MTFGFVELGRGTAAGTALVEDIKPTGGSYPGELTDVNGTLFFQADDGTHGLELWNMKSRIAKAKFRIR